MKKKCVNLINDILMFQLLTIIVVFFFINTINILTLWYLAGIYLFTLGFILLFDDGDIFIGFLWVIDLGVGLIFFIFILHFSNFLYQKTIFNVSVKNLFFIFYFIFFIIVFYIFLATAVDYNFNNTLNKSWFFLISWYDYYNIFFNRTITDLNLLRELYFYNNSFEFFLINFSIFYGIIIAINLTFVIKRIFNFLTFKQIKNLKLLTEVNSYLFIRNQNFIKQQNTTSGTRVWTKTKHAKI